MWLFRIISEKGALQKKILTKANGGLCVLGFFFFWGGGGLHKSIFTSDLIGRIDFKKVSYQKTTEVAKVRGIVKIMIKLYWYIIGDKLAGLDSHINNTCQLK